MKPDRQNMAFMTLLYFIKWLFRWSVADTPPECRHRRCRCAACSRSKSSNILCVAFCADIVPPWKIGQHLGQCHRTLPFQPARFLRRRRRLILAPPATLALGRGLYRLGCGPLACLDRSAVARNVTDQTLGVRRLDERLVDARRQEPAAPRGKQRGQRSMVLMLPAVILSYAGRVRNSGNVGADISSSNSWAASS